MRRAGSALRVVAVAAGTRTASEQADHAMKAELIPENGDPPIPITRDVTVVGRRDYCDIRIEHPTISKRHCVLVRTSGLLILRDLATTNGTKVKGQRIRWAALLPGDQVSLGGYKVRVYLGADDTPSPSETHRPAARGGHRLRRTDAADRRAAFAAPSSDPAVKAGGPKSRPPQPAGDPGRTPVPDDEPSSSARTTSCPTTTTANGSSSRRRPAATSSSSNSTERSAGTSRADRPGRRAEPGGPSTGRSRRAGRADRGSRSDDRAPGGRQDRPVRHLRAGSAAALAAAGVRHSRPSIRRASWGSRRLACRFSRWMASYTSWRCTEISIGAAIPNRTLSPRDVHHGDDDVIADDDALVAVSGQDQHGLGSFLLPATDVPIPGHVVRVVGRPRRGPAGFLGPIGDARLRCGPGRPARAASGRGAQRRRAGQHGRRRAPAPPAGTGRHSGWRSTRAAGRAGAPG